MKTGLIAVVGWLLLNPSHLAHGESKQDRSARVDALLQRWSEGKTPGAAVLVESHGKVVHRKAYGFADLDACVRMAPETSFRLASISKTFTAMAIMILAERGKIVYDDPLTRFFPEFPAYAQAITVRHLLHHTAGLREYDELFEQEKLISTDWPRSSRCPPDEFEPTSADTLQILARQKKPQFVAGNQYEYSNSGYVVLGQIVEKVSGMSYAAFLQKEIFKPLKMNHTIVSDGKSPAVAKLARSYEPAGPPEAGKVGFQEIDYTPLNRIYGDDGVHSTIDDLRRWAEVVDGPHLVSRKTLRRGLKPGRLNNGDSTDYGFGWIIDRQFRSRRIWHNGGWLGFKTFVARYPRKKLTVIVLANTTQLDATALGKDIARIFLERPAR